MGLRRVNEEEEREGPTRWACAPGTRALRRASFNGRTWPTWVSFQVKNRRVWENTLNGRWSSDARREDYLPTLLPLTQPTQREQSARFIALPLAPYRVSSHPCMLIFPEPCPLEAVHAQILRNSSCIGTRRQVAPAYRATRNHTHEGESRWRRESPR